LNPAFNIAGGISLSGEFFSLESFLKENHFGTVVVIGGSLLNTGWTSVNLSSSAFHFRNSLFGF
jgi:uncharacterized membrane protein YgdD (TMEM256/DUF423 family)